jgi:hypothetical protein
MIAKKSFGKASTKFVEEFKTIPDLKNVKQKLAHIILESKSTKDEWSVSARWFGTKSPRQKFECEYVAITNLFRLVLEFKVHLTKKEVVR